MSRKKGILITPTAVCDLLYCHPFPHLSRKEARGKTESSIRHFIVIFWCQHTLLPGRNSRQLDCTACGRALSNRMWARDKHSFRAWLIKPRVGFFLPSASGRVLTGTAPLEAAWGTDSKAAWRRMPGSANYLLQQGCLRSPGTIVPLCDQEKETSFVLDSPYIFGLWEELGLH